MEYSEVFRTGKLWEIDMARDALKEAGIPFFAREETLSGLRTAFPAAPAPGVGVTWCLLVPGPFAESAKEVLKELPIDVEKQPDYWDFTSHPGVIKWVRRTILAYLVGYAVWFIINVISGFR